MSYSASLQSLQLRNVRRQLVQLHAEIQYIRKSCRLFKDIAPNYKNVPDALYPQINDLNKQVSRINRDLPAILKNAKDVAEHTRYVPPRSLRVGERVAYDNPADVYAWIKKIDLENTGLINDLNNLNITHRQLLNDPLRHSAAAAVNPALALWDLILNMTEMLLGFKELRDRKSKKK